MMASLTRNELAMNEPATSELLKNEPAMNEPATSELLKNELAMNEPATSELLKNEPAMNEPATGELRTNELLWNELTTNQRAMGTPTVPLKLMVQLLKEMQFLISMLLGDIHHSGEASHMLLNLQL